MRRKGYLMAFGIAIGLAVGFPVMPAAATPGFIWATAELIETDDAGDAERPQVVMDDAGNALAVWSQSDGTRFNIWANRFLSGSGWGTPELIETNDADDAIGPRLASDPAGNAVTVWTQSDGTRFSIWANRFSLAAGWGVPSLLETDDLGDAFGPEVAMDDAGNAVAVWRQFNGTHDNIWANRFVPLVGWGAPELVEADASQTFYPQRLAMDPAGNAVAVWRKFDGTRVNISANRFVPGVGWGTAELIETDDIGNAFEPQVAMDPAGTAVAVWQQADATGALFNIWANRFVPGTGWGTAELIETGAGDARLPQVAMDAAGNAVAGWQQYDGTGSDIWANRLAPGVGWGTATLVETEEAGSAFHMRVAMDPSGNAVAVWTHDNGTLNSVWANRFVPSTGWGVETLIESGDAGDALFPRVAVNAAGSAVAVWKQSNGSVDSIWANRGVEDVSPGLVFTSPVEGEALPSRMVTVTGTASDDVGVAMVEISVDGATWVLASGTSSWSGTLTLGEGPNTIYARATDRAGNMASASIAVSVDTASPTAVAGEDQTSTTGSAAAFDAGLSSDDVEIVTYEWDFGDGATGTGRQATHVYTDPGTYTVTLTVRDAAGNTDSDVLLVTVVEPGGSPVPPEVALLVVLGVGAAAAVGALLLWRRRTR